jgi:micrococcal nuclease
MRVAIISLIVGCLIGIGIGYGLWYPRNAPGELAPATESPPPKAGAQTVDLRVTDGGTYRVRSVVDGDTIVLENGLHVRYHGVNCPEAGHFVKDAAPLSSEATTRNIELVEGKRVRLRLAEEPLDKYGRVIAHVLVLDEKDATFDVGKQLLRDGLGRVMTLGLSPAEQAELKECENTARASKLGMWGLEEKVRAGGVKPYCASTTGKVYHIAVCSVAARIKAVNRHEYQTADEAEAAGLNPCSVCKPR